MSKFDKITAVILGFLLSLFGAIIAVASIILGTIGNPDFMIRVLDNRNYYDSIFIEYCDEVEALAIPSGVDEGVFSSLVTKDEFKNDVNGFIRNAYKTTEQYAGSSIDYNDIYNRFYNSMVTFAEGKGISIDDELKIGLDNVAGICASTYTAYIEVPLVDTIGSYSNIFQKYLIITIIVSLAFIILFVLLIFKTKKWRNIAGSLFTIAFITDGLFLSIAPIILMLSGKISYLKIATRSLYDFAVGYCEHTLQVFIYFGITLILIPIIIYIVRYYLNKKKS